MNKLCADFANTPDNIIGIEFDNNMHLPIRAIQFGKGNFLRAFVDWMIDIANGQGIFNGRILSVQPIEVGITELLNKQDGLYTVLQRGIENGSNVVSKRLISSMARSINPYTEYADYLAAAENPDLRFVFSNTTEAGIAFRGARHEPDKCPPSFPAKLTAFLHRRFHFFDAAADKGLIIVPCELIEANGDTLKKYVLRYIDHWSMKPEFAQWVRESCHFVNTLVDRIVTGYPHSEAKQLWEELGYEDRLLDCCEPFNLFVIEGPAELEKELPLREAGLNVIWTDDLARYRKRKVALLNGAHTSTVLLSYLGGINTVSQMVNDELFGKLTVQIVQKEILPSLDMDENEKNSFADSVIERFKNPYIRHELLSISLNSVSKWKVRVLPTFKSYAGAFGTLPRLISLSLAGLVHFYRCTEVDEGIYCGVRDGREYPVKDDKDIQRFFAGLWSGFDGDYNRLAGAVLSKKNFWGEDLSKVDGFQNLLAEQLQSIDEKGVSVSIKEYLYD
ncbi:MAG: tagaturonate reductase [Phycisphaerae bacterium]|jgi:tagaturonate reductase